MACIREVDRSMFWGKVIKLDSKETDFSQAHQAAQEAVKDIVGGKEAMMIAWYDRSKQAYSPAVECCSSDMPGWLVYAKSRGANVIVSVDDERFVFVFLVEE